MRSTILVLNAFFIFTSFLFSQTIQWEQLNGPFGGTALSFASNSNGDIFAGADQDQRGIFRSTDGGITWQPKSNGLYLENRAFSWLVVDDSSYIIAGTNSHIGSKVYKSMDNGESWAQISILGGTSVAVNDSGHIYVGNTAQAQYSVSKDGGYTWRHYSHPSPFINCVALNDSGHIFIGGNYTGYRSKDNGASWTTLSLPDGINSIAVAPNGNLFAGCSRENSSNSGVYRSTDNGDSWTAVKEGFRVYASNNIVINNSGDIIVGTWGWGIWKSTDNGNTWNQKNSGLGHFYIKSMHITNNGDVYAGLNGGGIYRLTDNGEIWLQVGIAVASVKKIAINPLNGNLFAAFNGVSRSTDGGLTWHPVNNGLTNYDTKTIALREDGTIFCGADGGNYNPPPRVFRSTNNGDSWVRADTGLYGHPINAIAVDTDGNTYAGDYDGVCKSTNNGSSWFNIGGVGGTKSLVFNSAEDLFLASWGSGVWRRLNGDTVWTNITGTLYPYVDCLSIGSNDYIYAAKSRSTDNGITWAPMNISGNNVSSYAENSIGHLFCGTYNYGNGISRSTDFGDNWTQINTGLPIMDIRSVAVDSDDYLYAGSNGYSMFKTTTSTVTSVEEDRTIPTSFSLEQNFPNPFNPSTTISWQTPVSSWQTIKVFDVLGREIETIVDGYYDAGNHSTLYIVNSALPSGVYFYQLLAGEYTAVKKMLYLK